jgi:hypothetical protein
MLSEARISQIKSSKTVEDEAKSDDGSTVGNLEVAINEVHDVTTMENETNNTVGEGSNIFEVNDVEVKAVVSKIAARVVKLKASDTMEEEANLDNGMINNFEVDDAKDEANNTVEVEVPVQHISGHADKVRRH